MSRRLVWWGRDVSFETFGSSCLVRCFQRPLVWFHVLSHDKSLMVDSFIQIRMMIFLIFWLGVFRLGEVCAWIFIGKNNRFVKNWLVLIDFLIDLSYSFVYWFGDHSGGVTPGLVSIPEVKSSCVFGGTVGVPMGILRRCRPSHNYLNSLKLSYILFYLISEILQSRVFSIYFHPPFYWVN